MPLIGPQDLYVLRGEARVAQARRDPLRGNRGVAVRLRRIGANQLAKDLAGRVDRCELRARHRGPRKHPRGEQ